MRQVCSFRIPHSAFRILALLLAAQAAPGCIERFDDFRQGTDGGGKDAAGDRGGGDGRAGDGKIDGQGPDVAYPDSVRTDLHVQDRMVPLDVEAAEIADTAADTKDATDLVALEAEAQGELPANSCGDGVCSSSFETCVSCPADCGACCPDGSCDNGETCCTCSADCGPCCGNGVCDCEEACTTCEEDCGCTECGEECLADQCTFTGCAGKECGDDGCGGTCGTCPAGKSCQAGQCQVVCGDELCGGGEDNCNCGADCAGGCAGCCQGGVCKLGTANSECGKNGGACTNCSAGGEECQNGECNEKQTWGDPASGLTWQATPTGGKLNWTAAKAHCQSLSLEGSGWRLPMVKELRGLVSGCVGAGLEGDCNIGEGGCLAYACYDGIACFACKDLAGPGGGGCYWNEVMKGQCEVGYWSFSAVTDIAEAHWVVHFADGAIYDDVDDNQNRVRCVR